MVKKAIKGDVKACQFVRDTSGETPVSKTEITGKNGAPLIQKVFVSESERIEIDNQIDEIIKKQIHYAYIKTDFTGDREGTRRS